MVETLRAGCEEAELFWDPAKTSSEQPLAEELLTPLKLWEIKFTGVIVKLIIFFFQSSLLKCW